MHSGQIFIISIVAIAIFGRIVSNLIAARHGLPIESRWGRHQRRWQTTPGASADLDAERKVRLLSDENEKLVGKIGRLEERLAVLERIATDPAERTAREIEALRDR